jgi:hypothetical protein
MNIKDLKPQNGRFKQGYYLAKNPQKYYGDPNKIIYRSSYEKRFMEWVDLHPNISKWGSEPIAISYMHPIKKKLHNYYVDFFVHVKNNESEIKYLVEVKPESQTEPPKQSILENKKTGPAKLNALKRYNKELETYLINMSKFSSAKSFAETRGMKFIVCTEKFLF